MSNLSIRKETKEYKTGDKGIFATDMNYLLSRATNSFNFVPQNAVRLDSDIDKTWKIEKNGSDKILIRLGYIWRNGHFCKVTDEYFEALLSEKVNDELNSVAVFSNNIPVVNSEEEESEIPHGGLTGSSSIWYVAALGSNEEDDNIDNFDDWLESDHKTTQSLFPTRYHILRVTRNNLSDLYSGLNTHVDSCLYPIGCVNFTEEGKIVNIANTFLKQSINDRKELLPWDVMHYARKDKKLHINIGAMIIGGVRYDSESWVEETPNLFPHNQCASVVLENGLNFVYVEADFSSTEPVFQFKTTDDINEVVTSEPIYRRLLYTMTVDEEDFFAVKDYTRHISEDIFIEQELPLPFTFRVIKDGEYDKLQVYLLDDYNNNVFYNGQSCSDNDVSVMPVGNYPAWRDVRSVVSLPEEDSTTYVWFFFNLAIPSNTDVDWNYAPDLRWELQGTLTDSPPSVSRYQLPIKMCQITNSLSGEYTIQHARKGIVSATQAIGDASNYEYLGSKAFSPNRSIEQVDYNDKSLQLYGFDSQEAPDPYASDIKVVLTVPNDGGGRDIKYAEYIPAQTCEDLLSGCFWDWFCNELSLSGDDANYYCLSAFMAHENLPDIKDQTVGDDHRGNRERAIGFGAGYNQHPYLHLNGDSTRNAFGTGASIGDFESGISIHPHERQLYATVLEDDEIPTVDWQNRQLFNSEESTTLDWENKYLYNSDGEITVDWQERILGDGIWTVTDETAATFDGDGALLVNGGVYAGKGVVGKAYEDVIGGVAGDFSYKGDEASATFGREEQAGQFLSIANSEVKLVRICETYEGGYPINVDVGKGINVNEDGHYYHGNKQGAAITGWADGGIVTGTDIIEIDASDLQPTDKILVRRPV